jgi:hypothetical protein
MKSVKNVRAKVIVLPPYATRDGKWTVLHFNGNSQWESSHFADSKAEARRKAKNLRKRLTR